ncbi:MAG: site-specific DNA-methyltransferase [Methanosarcinales archaeon]|uniref:Type II methyltransferase n=1 Tax=Candidatus Ethanoperedens thermophilum TaxID=2766897 RepID=A0A848DB98_9EURY|nr:site-specific DNA-methyltransferase [Candidatus Ethanoperedens thermophilum]
MNHDSSKFYKSRLYTGLPTEKRVKFVENKITKENINKVFCKSSEKMKELPDNSVHLMITSPPYNVGKEYDENLSLQEYRDFLSRVWKDVHRVLVPGGRVCINIANLGRKPYIPLHIFIIEDMLKLGFLMRGEVIWNKAASASPSTAWGSWLSAKNPVLRDIHEYILVFSKDTFSRENHNNEKATMTRDEFLELTKSIWTFRAESARKIGHPAPFPVELPLRCIKLYTFENDVVLDPFMGSGTVAVAALMENRKFVGYDIEEEYVTIAEKRIKDILDKQKQRKINEIIH